MKLQHLVFSSNQLKGSRTFADWNIQKELTLYPMPQTHRVCCMSMQHTKRCKGRQGDLCHLSEEFPL